MTTLEDYKKLKACVEAMESDIQKFHLKKVKASGQRARNQLLNCKKFSDTLRKSLLADMKAIPMKHRTAKPKEVEEFKDGDELIDGEESVQIIDTIKPRKSRRANKV